MAAMLALCSCEKQRMPLAHGKPAEAVRRAVEKFSRGGEGWGWVQYPEIKLEIQTITNSAERASVVLASAEMIASMDLLDLPQKARISVASKYWDLTSQFYDLLVMDEISDGQRLKYLLVFLRKFRALSFSLPLCAQQSNESDEDFFERKLWAKDLYTSYDTFASRWHRVYKPSILRSIPSIDKHEFDKKTRFVFDYQPREAFLKNPVFTGKPHAGKTKQMIKSHVHAISNESEQKRHDE